MNILFKKKNRLTPGIKEGNPNPTPIVALYGSTTEL
jgi:hypothetical protein